MGNIVEPHERHHAVCQPRISFPTPRWPAPSRAGQSSKSPASGELTRRRDRGHQYHRATSSSLPACWPFPASSAIDASANVEPLQRRALEISGSQTFTNKLDSLQQLDDRFGGNAFLTGALRSTSGTNIWSGNVILAGTVAAVNYIGVDAGQLTITGIVPNRSPARGWRRSGPARSCSAARRPTPTRG